MHKNAIVMNSFFLTGALLLRRINFNPSIDK